MVLPPIRVELVTAAPPTLANSDLGVSSLLGIVMPKSWVPDPVFKSMPTPTTGSLCLISTGFPLSRGYGTGSLDPCVVDSGVQFLGFIGAGGPAQANGGVVPEFGTHFS